MAGKREDLENCLFDLAAEFTRLKPTVSSPVRFTSYCPIHGVGKNSDLKWELNGDGEVITTCKVCGSLTIDQIRNPQVKPVEVKPDTSITELPIEAITVNTAAQSRVLIDMELVTEYAKLMRDGVVFPPITVFSDSVTHWLSEGFHRLAAYREAAFVAVPCCVKSGGLREAILLSVGSNAAHGKRRSNADKRRSVEMLLKDECWASWSDSAISKQCAVDHKTVASVREGYLGKSQDTDSTVKPEAVRTAVRNGTTYAVKTAKIGKVKPVAAKPEPEAKPIILAMQPDKPEIDDGEDQQSYPYPVETKSVAEKNYAHYVETSTRIGNLLFEIKGLPYQILFLLGYGADNTEHWSVRQPPFGGDFVSENFEDYLLKPAREGINLPSLNILDKLLKLGSSEKQLQTHGDHQYFEKALEVLSKEIPDYDKKVATTESEELDKLKCELAYLKAMVREVYDGTATIRLRCDDEIAFDVVSLT